MTAGQYIAQMIADYGVTPDEAAALGAKYAAEHERFQEIASRSISELQDRIDARGRRERTDDFLTAHPRKRAEA